MKLENYWEWKELPCVELTPEGLNLVPHPVGKPGRLGYQELCRFLGKGPSLSEKEKLEENPFN
jgi:hypothetical protein